MFTAVLGNQLVKMTPDLSRGWRRAEMLTCLSRRRTEQTRQQENASQREDPQGTEEPAQEQSDDCRDLVLLLGNMGRCLLLSGSNGRHRLRRLSAIDRFRGRPGFRERRPVIDGL
ncbi:hypothetical protein DPEC_G00345190 [Dallia pectoralis]|uniref:Uncharacterized protein n=1 Tax=Dallia pectoralis TaxID=75939 RepID=A0ACC2F3G0_DALPE|nr:hypothetical protein DPEC_G00345190 [Dallia pectoralis]